MTILCCKTVARTTGRLTLESMGGVVSPKNHHPILCLEREEEKPGYLRFRVSKKRQWLDPSDDHSPYPNSSPHCPNTPHAHTHPALCLVCLCARPLWFRVSKKHTYGPLQEWRSSGCKGRQWRQHEGLAEAYRFSTNPSLFSPHLSQTGFFQLLILSEISWVPRPDPHPVYQVTTVTPRFLSSQTDGTPCLQVPHPQCQPTVDGKEVLGWGNCICNEHM